MRACNTFYVASGFRDDATTLIARFQTRETCTFRGFSQVWNDMQFTLVFSGRKTRSELLEFCEEVLDIAKEFISPDKTFKERIGGIFLLYGLFLRMPYRGPRIRMIMTEWENLLILQCEFYKEKQYEAIYILQQLIKKRAFGYCLFEQERGLENYYVLKDFMKGNPRSALSERQDVELTQILDDITKQSQIYVNSKENLEQSTGVAIPRLYKLSDVEEFVNNTKNSNKPKKSTTKKSQINDNTEPSTSNNLNKKLESSDDSMSPDELDDDDFFPNL